MPILNMNPALLVAFFMMSSLTMAHAETDHRAVVHNSTGQIAHLSNGTCVRTKGMSNEDACARDATPTPLSLEERTITFAFNSAVLSPEAKKKLDLLSVKIIAADRVKTIRTVGYADRIGKASLNEKLAQKRAEAVRNYLVAKGCVKPVQAKTSWLGKSTPTTKCPNTLPRPKLILCLEHDRRVEVEIDYITTPTKN